MLRPEAEAPSVPMVATMEQEQRREAEEELWEER